jgi:3-deoxy-D-manno-octulosonate 8-phosphate phosphatase (KDO 8-P phosphatase)
MSDNLFKQIKCLILDVDGVMTNSTLFMGDDGQEYKAFNSKDGHGIRMLQESGIDLCIITGRTSNVVRNRAKELGIKYLYQGKREKLPALTQLLNESGYKKENIAYVGDDVIDLPVMIRVALPICVRDAHDLVKEHSKYICKNNGGQGAVREVCEKILDSQGLLAPIFQQYLQK